MKTEAKRQHFIARFYLRNFAEPMFSESLRVYDIQKQRWEKRSSKGVGWFPHLCSMIEMEGNRTDKFDKFFKLRVEDPAAPAMKKLAIGTTLDDAERSAVAMFIALTAARAPDVMGRLMTDHLDSLTQSDREELDVLVECWCQWMGQACDSKARVEFLKPSRLGAIWEWSQSLRRRLLQWQWHLVTTSRERPFATSDRPVFTQWDREQDVRLVGFPVSSEIALIVIAGGRLNKQRDRANEVCAMNRQTIEHATQFVVACRETFPADDVLVPRGQLSQCLFAEVLCVGGRPTGPTVASRHDLHGHYFRNR